jgi:carboxyl-terminal processing protease
MVSKKLRLPFIIVLTAIVSLAGGYFVSQHQQQIPVLNRFQQQIPKAENKYLAFLQEVRQTIRDNYWQELNDHQFLELHVKALEKVTAQPYGTQLQSFADFDQEFAQVLERLDSSQQKQEMTAQLADVVLANLKPFGRSRLYSQQKKQNLANRVNNIDPEADHYQALQVEEDADQEEINQAYQQQKQELENKDTPEAKEQLAQVEAAHQTLSDKTNRARYDESGVNPTMEWRLVNPTAFYLKIKKFSPTTVQELVEVTEKVDGRSSKLNTLILDLRGNVGGAIDGLPYFLGPFIGNNQYAYQFIQQGKTTDYKTKTGWLPTLVRYKKVIVLIDDQTQSSAEVMASVLKKYNVGVLVGTTTKGWGTIERIFPLANQLSDQEEYSLFLVHHLTLRADGQPIEGNGVSPDIDINQSDWENQLSQYYSDPDVISAVKKQFTSPE